MRAHTKRHTVNRQPRRPDRWIHHQRVSYSEQFLFSLVYSLHYLLFYFVWLTFKRYLRWTTTFVLMHGIFVASLYVCRLLRLQLKEMRWEEKWVKQSSHKSRTRSLGIRFQKVFSIHRFVDWEKIVSRGASRCQTSVFMSLHCLASHQTKDVCFVFCHLIVIIIALLFYGFEFWVNEVVSCRAEKINWVSSNVWQRW